MIYRVSEITHTRHGAQINLKNVVEMGVPPSFPITIVVKDEDAHKYVIDKKYELSLKEVEE